MLNDGTVALNGLTWPENVDVPIALDGGGYPAVGHSVNQMEVPVATGSGSVSGADAGSIETASSLSVIGQSSSSPGFVIDATFDASITNLATSSPTQYSEITGAVTAAVDFLESVIVTPVTIGIDFGFGNVGTQVLDAHDIGESTTELSMPYSYSTVRTALMNAATSADDGSSIAALGTADPTAGGNFAIPAAEAAALGLDSSSPFAGYVGLSTTTNFDYDPNDRAVPGEIDAIGVLEHEITEVMGRVALLGASIGAVENVFSPLDLFRFSSIGTPALVAGLPAYFSVDGGTTALAHFNTVTADDAGDWAPSVVDDSFDAFSSPGVANTISATDLRAMDVLGYTLAPPCFVAGTFIRTTRGDIPVEELVVGDRVQARFAGSAPIRWIGRRHIDCRRHPEPHRVQPIRIVANAFAPGQPRRDLLLSPDHAVQVGDSLIVVRHLTNGTTIRQDHEAGEIVYFHIELDRHDILDAEGLPAESYLDTGNRGVFENADEPSILFPDLTSDTGQALREQRSCLPLVSDPGRLHLAWQELCERARDLGFTASVADTTDEPELLVTVGQQCLRPLSCNGRQYTYVVPSLPARLTSRSAIPGERHPWIDERRRLGVMVQRIVLRSESDHCDVALDDPRLAEGWWAPERDGASIWRWTNGDATLPPMFAGPAVLEITIGDASPYPVVPEVQGTRHAA